MNSRWSMLLINRLLESLPLIVMGLLAAGTYYLVQINVWTGGREAKPVQHLPDYSLIDFSVRKYDDKGQQLSNIVGARLDHYPDTDTAEVSTITAWGKSEAGLQTFLSANKATTNADGSELQLHGNARVWREASPGILPLDIKSEFLHVWIREERARTHLPVVITRGASVARGNRMEMDNASRTLKIDGRVTGTLVNQAKP